MRDAEHQATTAPSTPQGGGWAPLGGEPVELTPTHLVAMLHRVDDALTVAGIPLQTRHFVARTILYGNPVPPGAVICPRCAAVSHHPRDAAEGYCSRCSWWTGSPDLSTPTGQPLADAPAEEVL